MRQKLVIVFMMVLLVLPAVLSGAETKVIPLPDLLKPEQVVFDKDRMYVVEKTTVYIYSMKDFKLIKKFGKAGHGPQEFGTHPQMPGLYLDVQGEDLMIESMGKLSWFTKDGVYKKEQKLANPRILTIRRFGKSLLGLQIEGAGGGGELFQVLKLYDTNLKELKEIHRTLHDFQPGKGLRLLETQRVAEVYDGKLITSWDSEFVIKVFDPDLKELYTIKRDEKKKKVTEDDKKLIIDFLKTFPQTKDAFEFLKPFHFPTYYPAIQYVIPTGGKLYAVTFHENDAGHDECLIMDLKGKLLKRTYLPLEMNTPILPHPFRIHNGSVYQLVEDEEEEEWALHITEIK